RQKLGLDAPEEQAEMVPGHSVLTVDGQTLLGVALNARATGEPLQMKTRSGVKTYERVNLAGPVKDAQIDAMLIYTPEEYYQLLLDKAQPDSAAAHHELAERCVN